MKIKSFKQGTKVDEGPASATKKPPWGGLGGGVCLKKSEPILRRTLIDRLRFAPAERSGAAEFLLVDPRGLEPLTSCMPCKRSSQLSYGP